MSILRISALALFIGICASCTSRSSDQTSSSPSSDEPAVPGVGLAPDSSRAVSDSTIENQPMDTVSGVEQ